MLNISHLFVNKEIRLIGLSIHLGECPIIKYKIDMQEIRKLLGVNALGYKDQLRI